MLKQKSSKTHSVQLCNVLFPMDRKVSLTREIPTSGHMLYLCVTGYLEVLWFFLKMRDVTVCFELIIAAQHW